MFVRFFAANVPAGFIGRRLLTWGVFTFYMWLGSLPLNRAVQLAFLSLWITFFLLSAGDLAGMASLHLAGGYTGLMTAALAFCLAAADVRHTVVPCCRSARLAHASRGCAIGKPEVLLAFPLLEWPSDAA